ncbi:hypothetical protein F4823DRAFT_164829 [Ustulina deusta]|nr:hypothetical protein F4823DRAFT_164829 [Ustulina deusta]
MGWDTTSRICHILLLSRTSVCGAEFVPLQWGCDISYSIVGTATLGLQLRGSTSSMTRTQKTVKANKTHLLSRTIPPSTH